MARKKRRTQKEVSLSIINRYHRGISYTEIKKPPRKRTPEQIAKREANSKVMKENFGEYLSIKVLIGMAAEDRRREQIKANEAHLIKHPNKYNTTEEFFKAYPDEASCVERFIRPRLNKDGLLTCPYCRTYTKVVKYNDGRYNCKECDNPPYTHTVGTPLHNCKILMRPIFEVVQHETRFRNGLTVEKAAELIQIAVPSAFTLLNKLKIFGFIQNLSVSPDGYAVIDTLASGGNNINRQDHRKLTQQESLAKQKHALTIKTSDGRDMVFALPDLDSQYILQLLKTIFPKGYTFYSDEGTEFAGITYDFEYVLATEADGQPVNVKFADINKYIGTNTPIIVNSKNMPPEFNNVPVILKNYYNHITFNHSAGEHGKGGAESLNADMKQGIYYHSNNISKENFQAYLNFWAFHAEYSYLTPCQRFDKVIDYLSSFCDKGTITKIKKPVRRRSTFLKLQREKFAAKKAEALA